MRIGDICTRGIIEIPPHANLGEAAEAMRRYHVGMLVVCEEDGRHHPVGVLTDRDIVVSALALGLPVDTILVGDVMARPVETVPEDADLFEAASRMRERGVRRLAVCDASGALCGVVSADDLWGAFAAQLGMLSEAIAREQQKEMRLRR